DLEEERRLFYVVITRARHRLWLSFSNSRYRFGSLVQNDPSRFIEEVPEEYLDRSFAGMGNKKSGYGATLFSKGAEKDSSRKDSANSDLKKIVAQQQSASVTHTPSVNFRPSDPATS